MAELVVRSDRMDKEPAIGLQTRDDLRAVYCVSLHNYVGGMGAFERALCVWVICPAIGTRRSCSCRTHSEARNPYHAGNGISTKSCAAFVDRPMLYGVLGNFCCLQFDDLAGGWMVLPGCLS